MKFSRAFPAPLRLLVFGVLSGAASLHAGIVTVPAGLTVGQHYRLVFVTLDTYSPNNSNINFYNAAVNAEANGVAALQALNTVWRDIGSTPTVNAIDNIGRYPGEPIYNLKGDLVAADATTGTNGLWSGGLINPIEWDETGTNGRFMLADTGTLPDGTGATDGNEQLGGSGVNVMVGCNICGAGAWTTAASGTRAGRLDSLYAISGELTVEAPEPGTVGLTMLGVGFLLAGTRRRYLAQMATRTNR